MSNLTRIYRRGWVGQRTVFVVGALYEGTGYRQTRPKERFSERF